ncbi:hypothetical protein AWC38_SpisGene14082 [Stylophora pistillata]|uniref:4Fe-4S ferredoxin-type domain-containing protein n=1 Tax=Stylophora pistillata TaxID=50429 RepID=A0A2B4RW95_STYPI|nr:hypothetical protein AWC38_SpisGene14082 [Stylophora pistillata]
MEVPSLQAAAHEQGSWYAYWNEARSGYRIAYDLYEFIVTDDLTLIQGWGVGGRSLSNASVGLDAESGVFQDPLWPQALRDDLEQLLKVDRKHFVDMIKPAQYPDNYPTLDKIDPMKEGLSDFDIEDLDKMFYKTPIYVNFEDTERNHVGIPQPKCTACGNCMADCNVGAKNTLNLNYLPDAKAHGAELFVELIQGKGIDHTLTPLCMSHDSASGVISFDNKIDDIDIIWDRPGYERNFEIIDQVLERVVHGLGGTYVRNPIWSETFGRGVVSVHPLGGCPMEESGGTAVVNHAGDSLEI